MRTKRLPGLLGHLGWDLSSWSCLLRHLSVSLGRREESQAGRGRVAFPLPLTAPRWTPLPVVLGLPGVVRRTSIWPRRETSPAGSLLLLGYGLGNPRPGHFLLLSGGDWHYNAWRCAVVLIRESQTSFFPLPPLRFLLWLPSELELQGL